MLDTRSITKCNTFPRSLSRSTCPTTPPSTLSTMPQLSELTPLDSQLPLPQLLSLLPQLPLLKPQNKLC